MFKHYNLNRHYTSKHEDKHRNVSDKECARESEALLAKLQTHQGLLTKPTEMQLLGQASSFLTKSPGESKVFSDRVY